MQPAAACEHLSTDEGAATEVQQCLNLMPVEERVLV